MAEDKKPIFKLSLADSEMKEAGRTTADKMAPAGAREKIDKSQDINSFKLQDVDTNDNVDAFQLPQFEGDEDSVLLEKSRNNLPGEETVGPDPGPSLKVTGIKRKSAFSDDSGDVKINQKSASSDGKEKRTSLKSDREKSKKKSGSKDAKVKSKYLKDANRKDPISDFDSDRKGSKLWPSSSRVGHKDNQMSSSHSDMSFQQAQSDPYLARQKLITITLSAAVFLGVIYAGLTSPKVKSTIAGWYQSATEDKVSTGLAAKKSQKRSGYRKKSKVILTQMDKAIANGNCNAIIHEGLVNVKSNSISAGARVRTADCFQVKDNALDANMMLRPLKSQLMKMSDEEINNSASGAGFGDGFVLSVQILLSQGRLADAGVLVKNRCRGWKFSPTCIGKIMYMTAVGRIKIAAAGYQAIGPGSSRASPLMKAYFYWSGAKIAMAHNSRALADERHALALRSTPKSSGSLIREIYSSLGLDLFKRRNSGKLKRVITRAQQESTNIDDGVLWKLLLFNDLLKKTYGQRTLKKFFARSDISYRARTDFEFADSIGFLALKWNLGRSYGSFLTDVVGQLQTKNHSSPAVISKVNLWRVRALLAQGRYENVFKEIGKHERKFGADYVTRHIKGVTYMMINQHANSQLLAAREFRISINKSPSWQGFYALSVSLMRANEGKHAWKALKSMEKMKMGPIGKKWYKLALAEYYMLNNKSADALSLINKVLNQDPKSINAWEMKAKAYRKLYKRKEAKRAQQKADNLHRTVGYLNSSEGIYSPLGPLVFAD